MRGCAVFLGDVGGPKDGDEILRLVSEPPTGVAGEPHIGEVELGKFEKVSGVEFSRPRSLGQPILQMMSAAECQR